MGIAEWRTTLTRLMFLGAFACGILGLIVGLADQTWKLGVTGWFTGGTLLAFIALGLLADEFMRARRQN